ncbi:ion-transport protein YfeO [Enterobacter asburiae]|uniref:Ion-transport protein YfeO n=1 Tax=Enterobacter asburiae TaxID=61645 RepID=A0A376FL11_ENTAS|nr:ion-transport protein YfeO [Enterobacter asburiae]
MQIADIFSGAIVVAIAIALGMVAVWCLPRLHRLMHKLKHPVLVLGAGGLILGILGAIGGTVTLFKGLDEMQQLAFSQVFSVSDYLLFALIKLAALVVAAGLRFPRRTHFPRWSLSA